MECGSAPGYQAFVCIFRTRIHASSFVHPNRGRKLKDNKAGNVFVVLSRHEPIRKIKWPHLFLINIVWHIYCPIIYLAHNLCCLQGFEPHLATTLPFDCIFQLKITNSIICCMRPSSVFTFRLNFTMWVLVFVLVTQKNSVFIFDVLVEWCGCVEGCRYILHDRVWRCIIDPSVNHSMENFHFSCHLSMIHIKFVPWRPGIVTTGLPTFSPTHPPPRLFGFNPSWCNSLARTQHVLLVR
jgi:hypothetical protein